MESASCYIKEELIIPDDENDMWGDINLKCVSAYNNKSKVDHNEFDRGETIQTRNNIDFSSKFELFCPKCDESFKYFNSKVMRKCKICGTVLFVHCLNCNKQYRRQSLVIEHAQKSCSPSKNFERVEYYFCDNCKYVTISRCSLLKHMKCKHVEIYGKSTYQCFKCGEMFGTFGSRIYHQMSCGKPILKCEFCDYKTQHIATLRKHSEIHRKFQIFPIHERSISLKSSFRKCDSKDSIKNATDKSKKKRERSKKIQQMNSLTELYCVNCATKNVYRNAIRNCRKCMMSLEFHCFYPNCGAKYTKLQNIRIHIEKEHVKRDELKLCECPTCGKVFIHPQNLLSHKKGCSIGPYIKCDHCNFITRWSGSLAKHRKRHHKDLLITDFVCEKCKKGFSSAINLKHHSWYCGQSRITLRCAHCFYSTTSKVALSVHLKSEHRIF